MKTTRTVRFSAALLVGCAAFFGAERISDAIAQASSATYYHSMFHLNSRDVSGYPTGTMHITGGGSYDWRDSGYIRGSGSFTCATSVDQGPLAGCTERQGTRWSATDLLFSAEYACSPGDPPSVAVTGPESVAFLADFYRKGDGRDASFRAKVIVSTADLAPDVPGVQHVWIEGVGCGS